MTRLAVIGNISRDLAIYPGGRRFEMLGGAAFHVARAAAAAGLAAAPISVVGTDLGWIRADPRLAALDLTGVTVVSGRSCSFTLAYTAAGNLVSIDCTFGAAESLTSHCLSIIGQHGQYHVCCRRPLDVGLVLGRLVQEGMAFSADFHLASASELINAAVPFLTHAGAVFVNTAEYTRLRALINPTHLSTVLVSDGPRRTTLLKWGQVTAVVLPPDAAPVEVTGAGDALAGTFLAAQATGLSDADASRAAVTAATLSIQGPGLALNGQ